MDYKTLKFVGSNTGFLRNSYRCTETNRYYALQWDNGYTNPPVLYSSTSKGEPDCPVKKELYDMFIFPEGHEAYGSMLFLSAWEEIKSKREKEVL